ncbi:hypothetical protein FACS1894216_14840 [Synergistales bacterium]|nr:hypothetical protein FACS1894216_14840 [Synergistales bacterium]
MRSRFLATLIVGLSFIAVAVIGFVFYTQFRDLAREYDQLTRQSYVEHIDSLNKNILAEVVTYIEQEFPVLHDIRRIKREAGTDWFWEQSGKLTRIAKTFGFAYIYYIEKAENGYTFLMSSGIERDNHPEWLGGSVWHGPTPAFIDEAWENGGLTFSREPTVNEWGTLISAVLPIRNDGNVVGILGVDYDVSSLMQPLLRRENDLAGHGKKLLDRLLLALIAALVVIMLIMGAQLALDRTMVVIPAKIMEANERTGIMMDATPLICSIWDADGNMLDCNLEALKMLGISEKSEYIENFFNLNPEYQPDGRKTREKAAELIKQAFDTGCERFEWMYLTASGQELPVETTLVRVPLPRKGGCQLAAYSRDLREIKEKEAAVRETEERMRLMLDTMIFACCFFDENWRVIDCNQRAVVLFGCKDKTEFMDKFYALSPECQSDGRNSAERTREELLKTFADGKNIFLWEHLRSDGTYMPVEVTMHRVRWKDTYQVVSYMRDLSALRESQDNLKRVLSITEASPNLMLYVGRENVIEYMNPALSAVTGFSDEELLKGGLRLFFNPEDWGRIEREYFPAALQNRMVNFEARVSDKNGGRLDFAFSVFAAELRGGKTGIGLLGQDITELKQTQRSLMAATEQAEQALAQEVRLNKAKSDFLSRISHELRTPLNAIIGMTAVTEKSTGSGEQKHCLETIKESSEELLGMVNDILDITDIDAGTLDFAPSPFSFAAAMSSVISAVTPKANAKRQVFSTDIDGNIRDRLFSDKRRLTQMLLKLLDNAVKFTPEEGVISLSAGLLENRDEECLVRFEVADNGIGIGADAQQRIWEILEQEDNSITRKFAGIGIGLSLAKCVVELMGGEIRVESEPGKGSRFICDIPLGIDRAASEPRANDAQETDTDGPASVDFTGRRILLVDDVEINREILLAILEDTGALLDEARDGEEAVRMFSSNKYDLVLMDLHMPVMDGFSATKGIRASNWPWAKTVPVISVSAESGADLRSKCMDAGITGHLSKPIEINALFAMIAKNLANADLLLGA